MISGNISSLPRSMAKEKTSFENTEYDANEFIPPKRGPTLLKHDAAAEKFDSNPKGSQETSRKMAKKQSI